MQLQNYTYNNRWDEDNQDEDKRLKKSFYINDNVLFCKLRPTYIQSIMKKNPFLELMIGIAIIQITANHEYL